MTIGDLKKMIAGYHKVAAATYVITSVDFLLVALNSASRYVQRMHDFLYLEEDVTLAITSTGTTLAATTKKVRHVSLPIAASQTIPIEFLTHDEWMDRVRRQTGRTSYSAAATLDSLGVSYSNPICYQHGQKLYLVPASQFTFPVTATLSITKRLAEYTADANTDFLTDQAPDFLMWQGILELNKYEKTFAPREEGNLNEEEVAAFRDTALAALLQWDAGLRGGTSTPTPRSRNVKE